MPCDVRYALAAASMTALLLSAAMVQAGTYLQSEGDLNYSTGLGFLAGDRKWNSDGDLIRADCNSEYTFLSQYLEYGYSYYRTLYGGVNLARLRCGGESKAGFGDVTAGLRGRLGPARNNRAWELELNIPTSRTTTGSTRLGCGVFGLTGSVGTKEQVLELLRLGAEAGVQFWDSPLLHQFEGRLSADGALGITAYSRWKWSADVNGYAPLSGGKSSVDSGVSDCGTVGKIVRSSVNLGYAPSNINYFSCGVSLGVWGEDSSRRQGLYCGFSHLFKR